MEDDRREAEWTAFLAEIGVYLRGMFNLPSEREQKTWLYVLGLAAELEYLSLVLLWMHAGQPGAFDEFEDRLTLGQAAKRLEAIGLLEAASIDTLKEVARVRNSVAHRNAIYGVASAERDRGVYKGRHVFTDLGALKGLADDVNSAVLEIQQRCVELERPAG